LCRALLPQHLADLDKSGLSEDEARAAGLYSGTDPAEVGRLLNWHGPAKQLGPCLVFSFLSRDGRPNGYCRVKPDNPRAKKGKPVKYESPLGQPNLLYFPPGTETAISDLTAELIVTEGEKKALAAAKHGFACVGLVGVYGWQKKRDRDPSGRSTGPRVLIDDMASIPWDSRRVYIAFDSDAAANPDVQRAERALAESLLEFGADVRIVRLPVGPRGVKVGLDDFLLAYTGDELRELLATSKAPSTNGKPALRIAVSSPTPLATTAHDLEHPVFNSVELTRLAHLYLSSDPNKAGRWEAEKERLKRDKGISPRDVERAVKQVASGLPAPEPARTDGQRYFVAGNVIYKAGSPSVALCKFDTRIVAEVTTDDGSGEPRCAFRLSGRLDTGEDLPEVEVPAERYAGMEWVVPKWRGRAMVYVGQGPHLAVAIQSVSGNWPRETVYAHTGWRKVGWRPVYLHAGGAIAADGSAAGLRVSLPSQLSGYALPAPPVGERLRVAVQASLGLLRDLVPDEVGFPLLIAPYRAVIGGADYSLGLIGKTTTGKTELAALAQQHFGAGLVASRLPASFWDTPIAIESLAHAAKDALLAVDDFCPGSTPAEARRMQRVAEWLIRGQANQAGRSRCTVTVDPLPPRPPRGLSLITGEQLPIGASLLARLWAVEMARGMVNFDRLTECQEEAATGLYAESLAAFISWLAADYPTRCDRLRVEVSGRRAELCGVGGHNRAPTTAADLLATLDLLLEFTAAVGAINSAEVEEYRARGRNALLATAVAQAVYQRDADPAERFIELLHSVLSSGRAHLAAEDGTRPGDDAKATAAGWRIDGTEWVSDGTERSGRHVPKWRPQGERIGWLVDRKLLLIPATADAAVKALAAEQGQPLLLAARTLWKHLYESRHLTETKGGQRLRYTVPRSVAGQTEWVIVLDADRFFANNPPEGEGEVIPE